MLNLGIWGWGWKSGREVGLLTEEICLKILEGGCCPVCLITPKPFRASFSLWHSTVVSLRKECKSSSISIECQCGLRMWKGLCGVSGHSALGSSVTELFGLAAALYWKLKLSVIKSRSNLAGILSVFLFYLFVLHQKKGAQEFPICVSVNYSVIFWVIWIWIQHVQKLPFIII